MVKRSFMRLLAAGVIAAMTLPAYAQDIDPADSTGLPGDHFSLEGAVELFKKAESPEAFEKLLNSENNDVNNLDLNEDGEIDYIRVIDNVEGDVHAIVLQAVVNESESQDIAVIEIEKDGEESAVLQIVGDEDLYGEQLLVEPFAEEGKKGGKGGPSVDYDADMRIVVNVWLWPSVRFIYGPRYVVWASPWRWRYYPTWFRPWRPHPWRVFHVRPRPFHRHYHVVTTHRVVRAHAVYAPRRTSSKVVHTRTTTVVAARGKNGKVVAGRRTTTSTTVKGKNGGAVTKERTNTKVGAQGKNGGRVTKERTTTKVGAKGKNGGAAGASRTKTKTTRKRGGG